MEGKVNSIGFNLILGKGGTLVLYLVAFSLAPLYAQNLFKDITESAGINHQFEVFGGMFGGGICVFDFDEDGFEDLFITGGLSDNRLYHNNGDGTFTDNYQGSGLEILSEYVTQGAVGADVNLDGTVDLFITTNTTKDTAQKIPRAVNLLMLNNGNGTFTDATTQFRLDQMYSFSTGANFGDFNADGYPDLYVGNYFKDHQGPLNEISDATIVSATTTSKGYLLLNKKGKYFEDVYSEYGLTHKGFGFGGVFTDFDKDGDQDLFVNHDFGYKRTPNLLLENKYPQRKFEDVGEALGMDLAINSMGTGVGDYNGDGYLDYFFTDIRFNHLMVNQGPGKPFIDRAKELNMIFFTISWGVNFADFDHDGDLDLFVVNGDLNPNCVPMVNLYFENEQNQFTEIAAEVGLNDYGIGRGSVTFDMENDGDLDILMVNQKPVSEIPVSTITRLYRNDASSGNWIKIRLKGHQAESHGIGSRIELVTNEKRMVREIDGGGSSHLSQNSTIAHFGLNQITIIDSVLVYWTGGTKQILTAVQANQLLLIEEEIIKSSFNLLYLIPILVMVIIGLYFFRKNH